jgi:LysR family glycine cleavage system transcriptional activator
MSRRRLPPLNALRAFEAAARHLSFERAGDEIVVTASAIGQHVKQLEAWLRQPLFTRLPSKGVALTPLGERYAASITEALDIMQGATAQALRTEKSQVLTVSTIPSFAVGWLIPRLGSLKARHPDLEIRVSVSMERTDFAREDVDVAIRLGRGVYSGLRTNLLMEETFFPVCSADLLNHPEHPLRVLTDLAHHTLLHESADIPDYVNWAHWLAAVGIKGVDATHGPRFSHTFLALQAAASGQGVALATNVLIGDYLKAGRLVRPFPQEVKGGYQYYVVCPEANADRPGIAAFRDWLLDEAAQQIAQVNP